MKILHVVPGSNEKWNGIAVAAKLIAQEQSKSGDEVEVVEARDFAHANNRTIEHYSEVWVHSMWLPMTLKACWKVLRNVRMFECSECSTARPKLVRMTHANLDPLRYRYHGWKKRLVAPIERWLFRRTDRVVVTCEAEKKWCQAWGLGNEFEILDLKKFFKFQVSSSKFQVSGFKFQVSGERPLHLLYLGRRHPLKGVEFLERAVEELNQSFEHSEHSNNRTIDLRIVSDHFGEVLEKDWAWCDVLCLPTLSENFGLVVAEALERGKRVVTTDGAPVWGEGELFDCSDCSDCSIGYGGRLVYLKGYRDGTDEERVRLLKEAIKKV